MKSTGEPKRRRRKGEGSIYQRKDGRWVATLTSLDTEGLSRPVSRYARTYREAREHLSDLQRDRDLGISNPDGITVGEYLLQWLADAVKPTVRDSTYRNYSSAVRLYLSPELGRHRLSRLQPRQIQAYLNKITPNRADRTRKILVIALNQAVRWQLIPRNVASLTRVSERTTRAGNEDGDDRVRYLSEGQIRSFLAVLEGHKQEAFFTLLLSLGLRKGEALALTWRDVDLEARTLSVVKQYTYRPRKQIEEGGVSSKPKTRAGVRVIRLPEGLVSVLRSHRERQAFERKRVEDAGRYEWRDLDLLFPDKRGRYQIPSAANRAFTKLCKAGGLPLDLTPHALRHTCASILLSRGVPVHIVAGQLGHANPNVTLRIYAHALPSSLDSVASHMELALFGAG